MICYYAAQEANKPVISHEHIIFTLKEYYPKSRTRSASASYKQATDAGEHLRGPAQTIPKRVLAWTEVSWQQKNSSHALPLPGDGKS